MKKKTAALTLIGSFLTLALFATAYGSGRGSGYYERGSSYEYRDNGRYYDDRYRGNNGYERGSRYEYRGDGRYYDGRGYRGSNGYERGSRYEYRSTSGGRYYDDDRYEYAGRR